MTRSSVNRPSFIVFIFKTLFLAFLILSPHNQSFATVEDDLKRANELLNKANQSLKSDPEVGIIWLKEAQFIFKANADYANEVNCILSLSEIHLRLSDYDISYSLLTNAISKALEHNLLNQQFMALSSLGRVSAYLDETERAISFVNDGLELAKENKFDNQFRYFAAFKAYLNFYYKKDYSPHYLKDIAALIKYQESAVEMDTMMMISACNMYAGALYYIKKDPTAASVYYQKSIQLAEATGDKFRYSLTSNNYGEMLTKTGDLEKAEVIFRSSFERAKQVKSKLLIYNGFKHLSFCAESKGDFETSLRLYKSYESLKNEVLNETLIRKTRQVHNLYQLERKGRENDRIKAEQVLSLKESESTIRFYQYSGIFIVIMLVFLLLIFLVNRNRLNESISQSAVISEQNTKLQELNIDLWKQRKAAEDSKTEAEEAIKSKIDFLSIITHEIRTPLNAVIGTVQLLQEENPPPHQTRSLEILRFSAENLLNLVNDILDYNKIEAQKVELERKPFNLVALLNNIKNSLQMRCEEKGIDLRLRLDKSLPRAFLGDRLRLGQVIYNLLSNAIKFTEKGGVEIEVRYYPNDPNFNLEISVKDSGIGIYPDKIKTIFEFFSQADSSITRKFGGSGLGLTISRSLLNMMGSSIQLESEVGKGTRFFFSLHLPLSFETPIEEIEPEHEDAKITPPTGKILFVEDVEFNRVVAKRFFKKWNLDFDTAETGQEAIERAQNNEYQLILMDLQLPDMSGFTTTTEIRKLKNYQNTPILAMTAANYSEVKSQLEEFGINGFIPKPFIAAELKSAIFKWLSNRSV